MIWSVDQAPLKSRSFPRGDIVKYSFLSISTSVNNAADIILILLNAADIMIYDAISMEEEDALSIQMLMLFWAI